MFRVVAATVVALSLLLLPNARAVELVVTDTNALGGPGGLFAVDSTSGARGLIASGTFFDNPWDVARTTTGDWYVTSVGVYGGNGALIRVDRATGKQDYVMGGDPYASLYGLAPAPAGQLYWVRSQSAGGYCPCSVGIQRVDPATGTGVTITKDGLLSSPYGIAVAPDGTLVVADAARRIVRVDPATGAQSVVASDGKLTAPLGVAVAPDGTIYVADSGNNSFGQILRVDPATGEQTDVSNLFNFPWIDPTDIAIGSDGLLYVTDSDAFGPHSSSGSSVGPGGVVRVDPATGATSTVAAGGDFIDPTGIAVTPPAPVAPTPAATSTPAPTVTVAPPAATPPVGTVVPLPSVTPPAAAPQLRLVGTPRARSGAVSARFSLSERARVRVEVRHKRKLLGSATAQFSGTRELTVRLSRTVAKALRGRRTSVTLRAEARFPSGASPVSYTRTLTYRG